ncbi:esterase [Marinomonas transparens]|uniref:Esterase n=1 Tax=Marinomonas transparens TaxID=2795388 RepID=A0A934JSI1_9GAMM|nr:esterase [Marinomonas transparens]MBJ7536277.1 esterase [Marinomonas transparens]
MSSIVVQNPTSADQLFLLFHGVGATPQSLEPLGKHLAQFFPMAAVISIQAPEECDLGQGFQWFSVQGVTEENRSARITAALPLFENTIQSWQTKFSLSRDETTLIGFSQGAIMSLSSTQTDTETLAHKVISLSGRFAVMPTKAPINTRISFLHGDQDQMIDYRYAEAAYQALNALGADVTFDLIPNLGHTINQIEAEKLIGYLQ